MEADRRVETAWDRCPMLIGGLVVVEVHHIDFLESAPLDAVTIHLGNAIGREIGDFDADGVDSVDDIVGDVHAVRNGEEMGDFSVVDEDVSCLTDIAKVEDIPAFGREDRTIELGGIDARGHGGVQRVVAKVSPGPR